MLSKILLAILSLVFLSSCSTIPRPKGSVSLIDAPRNQLMLLDMEQDYDKNGEIKSDATVEKRPVVDLMQINKYICFDPNSWAELNAYKRKLKAEYEAQMKACN